MSPVFTGPASLRHPREGLALLGVLLWAIPIVLVLRLLIHEDIGPAQVALFIVLAMLYVTLARGRLIGSSVLIHEAQNPRVFAIVKRACAALEIPMPLVFVREDYRIPAVALGFGDPYSLVLSSNYIEHFEDDELAFIIGRQLGHIAAGHTRYISLLSVNGNENFIVALIFGPWLRVCELTSDKVGLLVCGSLDAAARAIAVSMFHHFGRKVNVEQFAEQGREIANDSILRWGEWLGGEPYATRRIAELKTFMLTQQFATLEEWFLSGSRQEPPPALPPAGATKVQRSDCAGWWRRTIAYLIDVAVITSLVGIFHASGVSTHGANSRSDSPAPVSTSLPAKGGKRAAIAKTERNTLRWGWFVVRDESVRLQSDSPPQRALSFLQMSNSSIVGYLVTALYYILLVTLAGQTFGMMIAGLRVVTVDFRRPGFFQIAWRYVMGFALLVPIVALSIIYHRILLHDRWSKTRLITAERALARAGAASTTIIAPAT